VLLVVPEGCESVAVALKKPDTFWTFQVIVLSSHVAVTRLALCVRDVFGAVDRSIRSFALLTVPDIPEPVRSNRKKVRLFWPLFESIIKSPL
jgi:hypothetical protein